MSEIRDVARATWEAGISVVPPRQNGTKAPEGFWERYQTERADLAQIDAWYSDPSRTGVGFVAGAVSGGLELFEFEGRAADAGVVARFIQVARERGLGDLVELLASGYSEKSPSGGLHFLYRCTETGCVKLAKNAAGKDLIETKGEGGYMITAPTNGTVHKTGGSWQMLRGGIDTIPTISPDQRRQLFDLAAEFDEWAVTPPADETPAITGPFTNPARGRWVHR